MSALAERAPATPGFRHEAFLYRDAEEFCAGSAQFAGAGLEADEAVLVAVPPQRIDLLRDTLGRRADQVEFVDITDVGRNPARILPVWLSFVDRNRRAGRGFRGIGEPMWSGRRPAEAVECHLHERLLNRAFDAGPAWRLLCPYDEAALPAGVVAEALRTHPFWVQSAREHASEGYGDDVSRLWSAPLPEPPAAATEQWFGPADIAAVRAAVSAFAAAAGLSGRRLDDLVVAANELATNSVRHGGPTARLCMWRQPDGVVLDFSDAGRLADPLVGRRPPALGHEGGRGLFLVNHLCDLVQIRSSEQGTSVRVTHWL